MKNFQEELCKHFRKMIPAKNGILIVALFV